MILSKLLVFQTINASFPPSSKTLGFKFFQARDQIEIQALSHQVKLTQTTFGFSKTFLLRFEGMGKFT
jgi:hypothetical protein